MVAAAEDLAHVVGREIDNLGGEAAGSVGFDEEGKEGCERGGYDKGRVERYNKKESREHTRLPKKIILVMMHITAVGA